MKNDLDFIKDKFENCGVNAPESLSEQNVLKSLPEKEKQPKVINFMRRGTAAAVYAVFTAAAVLTAALFANVPVPVSDSESTGENIEMVSFRSRSQIKSALREINTNYNTRTLSEIDGSAVSEDSFAYVNGAGNTVTAKSSAASSAAHNATYTHSDGHSTTYRQVAVVDEADTVKTNDGYVFYLCTSSEHAYISVLEAKGKNTKEIAKIKASRKHRITAEITEFYVFNNRLVALERISDTTGNDGNDYVEQTRAEVFDISDAKSIKKVNSFTQSGSYCSSRMIESKLYLISTQYSRNENDLPKASPKIATDDEATPNELKPSDVYSVQNPTSANFLIVSGMDIGSDTKQTATKAILGSASEVYCNEENLFVTAEHFNPRFIAYNVDYELSSSYVPFVSDNKGASADEAPKDPNEGTTQIIKISLKDGISFIASTRVKGRINNQYSMDEKDGNLRVATTTTDKNFRDTNNLFVLDKNLRRLGSVKGFAKDESIKAVRYIGDTAYVITYEETDPLFIIDVSNPRKPQITGSVKISGFSTLLVPVDDNTLLGLGYHTVDEDDDIDMEIQEGVKLALFDVSDKSNPKVFDEKIFKDCDSAVQYNPKALLVNFSRSDYTIPLNNYEKNRHGALNFKVENGKIKIVERFDSEKAAFGENDGVERCAFVGNTVYLLCEDYSDDNGVVVDCFEYK